MNIAKIFGKNLKIARKSKKMTQEALADAIGIEPPSLSRWETGKTFPSHEHITKLCSVLKLSPDLLFKPFESSNDLELMLDKNDSPDSSPSLVALSKLIAEQSNQIEELKLLPKEKELIEAYRNANAVEKVMMEALAGIDREYTKAEVVEIEKTSEQKVQKLKSS